MNFRQETSRWLEKVMSISMRKNSNCSIALIIVLLSASFTGRLAQAHKKADIELLSERSVDSLSAADLSSFKRLSLNCDVLWQDHLSRDLIIAIGHLTELSTLDPAFQDHCMDNLWDRIGVDVDGHGYAYLSDKISVSRDEQQQFGALPKISGRDIDFPNMATVANTMRDRAGIEPLKVFKAEITDALNHGMSVTSLIEPKLTLDVPHLPTNPELRSELLTLKRGDNASQQHGVSDKQRNDIQAEDLPKIKHIVAVYGFPNASEVSRGGVEAVFILIQHAGSDPALIQRGAELAKPLARNGDLPHVYYALLIDRSLILSGKDQIYGTQVGVDAKGAFLYPIKDPSSVNVRRAEMYMVPIEKSFLDSQRRPAR